MHMTFDTIKTGAAGLATMLLMTAPVLAGELTTFENCTDARGRAIAIEPDGGQPMLVRSIDREGQPLIRYNPRVLPRLSSTARMFFYAHQCARQGREGTLSAVQARETDCVGLNTLLDSNLISREALPGLQAELEFTTAEWELLPGPPRAFDLTNCQRTGVLRLPAATMPPARQVEWNACLRNCADRLWSCQKGCRGGDACDTCVATYQQCKDACNAR